LSKIGGWEFTDIFWTARPLMKRGREAERGMKIDGAKEKKGD
jgi:hypothetical protein